MEESELQYADANNRNDILNGSEFVFERSALQNGLVQEVYHDSEQICHMHVFREIQLSEQDEVWDVLSYDDGAFPLELFVPDDADDSWDNNEQ